MKTPLILAVLPLLAVLGCGGESAAPTSSPTAKTPDAWAVKTCTLLATLEGDYYDTVTVYAGKSTDPELVGLAAQSAQVGSSNLIRAWCIKNYPQAGVKLADPQP